MRTIYAFLLLLALSPPLAAQDCNVNLNDCQLCGPVLLCNGGDSETTPLLLTSPDTSTYTGVQAVVGTAILRDWHDALLPTFDNPNRIYLPREQYRLTVLHPTAPASDIVVAAQVQFQHYLFSLLPRVRVTRSATGDGGTNYSIASTTLLMTFVVNLLNDNNSFDGVDLKRLYDESTMKSLSAANTDADKWLFELFKQSLERDK